MHCTDSLVIGCTLIFKATKCSTENILDTSCSCSYLISLPHKWDSAPSTPSVGTVMEVLVILVCLLHMVTSQQPVRMMNSSECLLLMYMYIPLIIHNVYW